MGAECCKATGSVGHLNLFTNFANDPDLKTSISQASGLLRKAQSIKQTLQNIREKSETLTTIPLRDPVTFIQNVQVLQWALSGAHQGSIQQTGFAVSAVSPFLDVTCHPMEAEYYELLECLRLYFDTVTNQANTMKQIAEDLYDLRRELNKWKQTRETQNEKEGDKAMSYKKLVQEMKAITDTEESLREAHDKIPWIIEKVQSLVSTADQVGFQADREGLTTLKDIVNRFRICLESGQEKKKWVMRSNVHTQDALKTRDGNIQHADRGKSVKESGQTKENKDNAKQFQSFSFKANFSSNGSNSRNRDSLSPFHSTKDSTIGEKSRPPLANLRISELDKNNLKMKESSVTFRVKASELENNGKFIQLGSKQNPFTIGSTEVSAGSLNDMKGNRKTGSVSLIKDKIGTLDLSKLNNVMNENLVDDDNLSISIVQDSARKHAAKAQW